MGEACLSDQKQLYAYWMEWWNKLLSNLLSPILQWNCLYCKKKQLSLLKVYQLYTFKENYTLCYFYTVTENNMKSNAKNNSFIFCENVYLLTR